ncbi:MAG: heme NO-binding domain-containing protein [Ktedonobacteraceae bacterium]|nr:heme NO-binding domain-containing protein [Ktedonobacteraceae bacterium]
MQGLIFVTWEKYLAEHFGEKLLYAYRAALGETAATAPLVSRIYDDRTLLAGVSMASKLTRTPVDTLLQEYGRYFMINGLTRHLCMYLLAQVHSGCDLLLVMSDAHAQMHLASDALTPPLFKYVLSPNNPRELVLIYDSPRKLCPVLLGAIEGAAQRYGETVHIREVTCMRQGAPVCRFEVRFSPPPANPRQQQQAFEQSVHWKAQQRLAHLVLMVLPTEDGLTLADLQRILQRQLADPQHVRPKALLDALNHLQHAGLVSSTANQPGDNLTSRRYWRAPQSNT